MKKSEVLIINLFQESVSQTKLKSIGKKINMLQQACKRVPSSLFETTDYELEQEERISIFIPFSFEAVGSRASVHFPFLNYVLGIGEF